MSDPNTQRDVPVGPPAYHEVAQDPARFPTGPLPPQGYGPPQPYPQPYMQGYHYPPGPEVPGAGPDMKGATPPAGPQYYLPPGQQPGYAPGMYPPGQPYGQPIGNVVVTQPSGATVVVGHNPPPDHIVMSVLACLFCCPIGCFAVMYSCQARSANLNNNYTDALHFGRQARKLALASIVIGAIVMAISLVLRLVSVSNSHY